MKKIYLVLTHTGTTLSTIIKCYTRDEFSHISVALDADLEEMYSFGRINPYNPFWGSFVHENIKKGTFKRFKNTKTEVYSLMVTEEQYEKAEKIITYFSQNKQKYSFNILGLFCVSIKKRIIRKNTFYCAEFVKHLLKFSGIIEAKQLPLVIKPQDFKNLEGLKLEYSGYLRNYQKKKFLGLKEMKQNLQGNKIEYV